MRTRHVLVSFRWVFSMVLGSRLMCVFQNSGEDLRGGGWAVLCIFLEFFICVALSSPSSLTLATLVPVDSQLYLRNTGCLLVPPVFLPPCTKLQKFKAVNFAHPKTDLIFPITVLCLLSSVTKIFFHVNLCFWAFQVRGKIQCLFNLAVSVSLRYIYM